MTTRQPIYFEHGIIRFSSKKKQEYYSLIVYLNPKEPVTIKTGLVAGIDLDEIKNEGLAIARKVSEGQIFETEKRCEQGHKMINLDGEFVCFKCSQIQNERMVAQN